jgi:hypothetical protein
MAEQSFWQRVIAVVNREYDRRIRRASLVTEYGAGHHAGHHDTHDDAAHDDEAAAIMNVPKGTPLARRPHPPLPSETDPSS